MTLHQFFMMGGYAEYVWSAYGIVFFVLVGIMFSSIKEYRKKIKNFTTVEK